MKYFKSNRFGSLIFTCVLIAIFAFGSTAFGEEISLDFSRYPDGPALRRGIESWESSGTDNNPYYENSLRLLYQGSTLSAEFYLDHKPQRAKLEVTHLSSKSGSCRGNGYSPVTISINGSSLVRNYDVAQHHDGSHGYETDGWDVSSYLHQGPNKIKWKAGNLCTHYWIKKFEINTESYPSSRGKFVGEWINVDPGTAGITRLVISKTRRGRKIKAFGQCHPEDCDWGTAELNLIGDNVSDYDPSWAMARWDKGFAETTLVFHFSDTALVVESYTVFKDDSGRANYRSIYRFRRR